MKVLHRDYLTFCFSLLFSVFCFGGASALVDTKNSSGSILDYKNNLSELIEKNKKNYKSLDYYSSKGLSIILPNGKVWKINWGDVGSGDILTPFSSLEAVIEDAQDTTDITTQQKEDKKDTFVYSDLLKLWMKAEIKKFAKTFYSEYKQEFTEWGWLIGSEVSAVRVFSIKMILLMMHDFSGNEIRRKIEIFRLLFRLSQSKVLNVFDENLSFFSYLPNKIEEKMRSNMPQEWQDFIDKCWNKLKKGLEVCGFDENGDYDLEQMGIYCCGYRFDDPVFARETFDSLKNKKNYTISDFENDIEKSIPLQSYLQTNFQEFGRVTEESKIQDMPAEIKDAILSVDSFPKVKLVKVAENETWIIYVSSQLSLFETVKLLFSAFIKGISEYNAIKSNNIKDGTDIPYTDDKAKEELKIIQKELEGLENKKHKIESKLKYITSKVNKSKSELDYKKKKTGFAKSKFGKDIIKQKEDVYNKNLSKQQLLLEKLSKIITRIGALKGMPEYFLGEYDIKSNDSQNIFQVILHSLVKSPEVKKVLTDINSVEKYKCVKSNLYKKIGSILKNSENVKDNFELWSYFLISLSKDFEPIVLDLQKEWKDDGFFDELLGSLFGV